MGHSLFIETKEEGRRGEWRRLVHRGREEREERTGRGGGLTVFPFRMAFMV